MEKPHTILIYIFAAVALMFTACMDDENFSLSKSDLLTFSADSIKLDTVFSTVPSSTRSFWAYNKTSHDLRCKNIRLDNGNQIGFRANVDGTYLSPASGYQVNDIEIRKGDSIRVFIELTSTKNFADVPQKIEDNLVFTLESGAQQKINLNAYTWDADIIRGLEISADTTISASSKPLVVYGGITIAKNATLTIAPGSTLYFHGDGGIDAYGRLICNGTADKKIELRGDRLDNMFDYLPYNYVSGQWPGIHLYQTSYNNILEYTEIHSTYDGLKADSSDVKQKKLTLRNSTIHNCQGYALYVANSYVEASNLQLTNSLNACLAIENGKMDMNNCTLAQCYPFDSNRGPALSITTATKSPFLSFECKNSLITGFSSDEMQIAYDKEKKDSCKFTFDHCVIRTPKIETEDSVFFKNVIFEDATDTTQTARKHFVKIDDKTYRYDFHLLSGSKAIDSADPKTAEKTDHDGTTRDEKPDIGAFEYATEQKTEEK